MGWGVGTEAAQRCGVDQFDALAGQPYPARVLEALELPGDDLAYGAQLIGQRLARQVHHRAVAEQGSGQPLIQALECRGFRQRHQVGERFGKEAEHEAAKPFVCAPGAEARRAEHQQARWTSRDAATRRALLEQYGGGRRFDGLCVLPQQRVAYGGAQRRHGRELRGQCLGAGRRVRAYSIAGPANVCRCARGPRGAARPNRRVSADR